MARNTTLADLIADIRTQADIRANRWPDATLTRLINASIAELYEIVVSANHDHYLTYTDVSVVSGTANYSLPETFYRAHGVDVLKSDGKYKRMEPFIWEDRNLYQEDSSERENTRYRIMGGNLRFLPTPTWTGTVRFWFIAAPTSLSAGTDTYDGVSGWEQYVVNDCCIKVGLADETNVSGFMALKQQLTERIKHAAQTRDRSNADRVRDVRVEKLAEQKPWLTLPRPT